MMPCLRQFTEVLRCPACVNLQRFYAAPLVSIYRDFIMPSVVSIYRAFMRQFIEIPFEHSVQTFFTHILDHKITIENCCKC